MKLLLLLLRWERWLLLVTRLWLVSGLGLLAGHRLVAWLLFRVGH